MLSILNRLIIFLFYSIIILKSPIVWSSDLEKIKKIDAVVSLNEIKLLDYNKNSVDFIDKEIDFYILNFWASWCAPCIKEMKSLDNLKKNNIKIKVITVSQDSDINDAISFFKKNNYKNLENYYDYDKAIAKNFSLRGLPTTFIFNKELKAFAKVEGIIEWDSEKFSNWLKKIK